ncbi:hypothetical protein EZV62_000245 [Acer yangbiense]|uniref:PPM-type phosphatase domain-containing protein n=1 Tax=Acer yangbiense TaxID=1000413 RepID=A0A5C7ITG9_9ROSI|nr:hypothetical protein EZV62_000245 [Acer yangbiense]
MLGSWVRESVPSSLLCNWQEALTSSTASVGMDADVGLDRNVDIWRQSCLKTYASIDQELKQNTETDSFHSGTTALTIVKQGENLVAANVGDSRAVLATLSDDGSLVRWYHFSLPSTLGQIYPEEAERIKQLKGLVFCLHDEPGVYRVWMPNGETPGLAISRGFGDYCVRLWPDFCASCNTKKYNQQRPICHLGPLGIRWGMFVCNVKLMFLLISGQVWDAISNQEAVEIVSSTLDREKSAKKLVECAVRAWKYKKRGIAMDDISAICLFFHFTSSPPVHHHHPNLFTVSSNPQNRLQGFD